MKTTDATINKLDIYIDSQMLYKYLYKMQKRITKNDRKHLYPWILISTLDMAKSISLAKRVKAKQLEHIEEALGYFETIKLILRSCIELNIIKATGDKIELFTIVARIDKSFDKWYSYKSDMTNKAIIAQETKRKEEFKKLIKEAIFDDASLQVNESVDVDINTKFIQPMTLRMFVKEHPIFMNRDSYEMISKHVHGENGWICIYGSSKDDLTRGSIKESAQTLPGLIGYIFTRK